ncbi:MAG: LysR family transcriptional regulator [Hyphomonas sp.]|nr:LysR family transcriptional regulator [Hyphomonas sp.]
MRFLRLRHVVEVDRQGSITAAANALNTTQSTVTKSVAAMEQEVGYALFVRKARGVTATEKGREFLNRASRVLSDVEHLIEDSRSEKAAADSLLRIGVCPGLLQGLLNRAMCKVIQKHANTRLQLQAVSAERGVLLLQRGDVDLLVGPKEMLVRHPEFVFEATRPIEASLYVRKGHPLTKKAVVKREHLRAYPIIAPAPMNIYTDVLMGLVADQNNKDPLRQLHIVEYFPMAAQIVETTDAVSVISKDYAGTKSFRRRFDLVDLEVFELLEMGCAWHTRWLPSRSARLFVSALALDPQA